MVRYVNKVTHERVDADADPGAGWQAYGDADEAAVAGVPSEDWCYDSAGPPWLRAATDAEKLPRARLLRMGELAENERAALRAGFTYSTLSSIPMDPETLLNIVGGALANARGMTAADMSLPIKIHNPLGQELEMTTMVELDDLYKEAAKRAGSILRQVGDARSALFAAATLADLQAVDLTVT